MRFEDKVRLQRQRRRKFFWLFAAAALFALLFGEHVIVLYALAPIVIFGLLIEKALSHLGASEMQGAMIHRL